MSGGFQHRQSAHCETGVLSNLLVASGHAISEPMTFGLSAGLSFAYIPMIKLAGLPLIAYRTPPGAIRKSLSRRIGARWDERTFSDQDEGMRALDQALDSGARVGVQTGIYWLPYIPADMRFHFNAHNLVVAGREGDDYLISDPVLPQMQRCARKDLQAARFARGPLAPRGRMYRLAQPPGAVDLKHVAPNAIRANARMMLTPVAPIVGVNGVRFLGRVLQREAAKSSPERLKALLGHIVRMQEEIGTGGAGFRFLYAAFLKEASDALARPDLAEASRALTDAGDEWRRFALQATKMCRGRSEMNVNSLAAILNDIAGREAAIWGRLARIAA